MSEKKQVEILLKKSIYMMNISGVLVELKNIGLLDKKIEKKLLKQIEDC